MADISQTESEEVNSDCNLLETRSRHKQYTKIPNEALIVSVFGFYSELLRHYQLLC